MRQTDTCTDSDFYAYNVYITTYITKFIVVDRFARAQYWSNARVSRISTKTSVNVKSYQARWHGLLNEKKNNNNRQTDKNNNNKNTEKGTGLACNPMVGCLGERSNPGLSVASSCKKFYLLGLALVGPKNGG